MNTKNSREEFPTVQGAIYGVALSLDSFLLNGIPYGVLQAALFPGLLEKVASNLWRDLLALEQQTPPISDASQARTRQVLSALRGKCQQLIDLVTGLRSFEALPLQQLRSTVAQIPLLRRECVQLIQELESCFQVPKPFYQSRPSHSTASVENFLTQLERNFVDTWNEAMAKREQRGSPVYSAP